MSLRRRCKSFVAPRPGMGRCAVGTQRPPICYKQKWHTSRYATSSPTNSCNKLFACSVCLTVFAALCDRPLRPLPVCRQAGVKDALKTSSAVAGSRRAAVC